LFLGLKRRGFDVVVDLRNSMFGVLIPAGLKTSPFLSVPRSVRHMKDRHLYKVRAMAGVEGLALERPKPVSFYISPRDEAHIDTFLKGAGIKKEERFMLVSPGARSHVKRWTESGFAGVIEACVNTLGMKVILIGDASETGICGAVRDMVPGKAKNAVIDASGKTSLSQLGVLLKKARFLITNDSANMHLASYLNIPVAAVFGPTDEVKYGPWADAGVVVKKDIFCRPCAKAQCRFKTLDCMRMITVTEVMRAAQRVFAGHSALGAPREKNDLKRILITRTDRMGDVVLSTPAIKVLRDNYPNAYIAMAVSPYTKDIVEGNPYLDEVITCDKNREQKWFIGFAQFALSLRRKKFDAAFILHPTARMHLTAFLSGIPRRIGYDRKLGFLLTDRIPHVKQEGQKHEMEYTLDVLRHIGVDPVDARLYVPLTAESAAWADKFLKEEGVAPQDALLAVHPSSSCISRRWPLECFAEAANRLAEKYSFSVLIIADTPHIEIAKELAGKLRCRVIDASGRTTVSRMAGLLKRCRLFISNDSGPVHVAAALGVPVISLFGRNQKGLSPLRWGPVGENCIFLHKDAGCMECLAHNCVKDFACLKAITVDEVVQAAEKILARR
ncbi:MAG: glycosyltransferase family 9 protein, partial [Candidatus Omnitrophota bacterium]